MLSAVATGSRNAGKLVGTSPLCGRVVKEVTTTAAAAAVSLSASTSASSFSLSALFIRASSRRLIVCAVGNASLLWKLQHKSATQKKKTVIFEKN